MDLGGTPAVGSQHASGVGFAFGPDRAFAGHDPDYVIGGGRLTDAYR